MRRFVILAVVVAFGGAAGLGHTPDAAAGAGDADEAAKLREESGADWNAGRYREAADKLRRAATIYERAPEKFVADLGTVRRAIVWNLVKAGDAVGARETFTALLGVYGADASVRSDAWSAYQALYEAAKGAADVAGAQAVLEPVREAALAAKTVDIASQALHDLGSISRDRGDRARAATYFERAIEERHASSDRLGEAWSLNNLANLDVGGDRWRSALAPLLAAQRIVVGEGVGAPALTVATNLRTVFGKIDATSKPDADVATWLDELAKAGVGAEGPVVIPTDHLLRRALAAKVAGAPNAPATLAAARALVESAKALKAVPPETRADLVLGAAKVATESGGGKVAAEWLHDLDVGTGPAAPHLAARAAVERARAAVAGGAAKTELTAWIASARTGLRELGDRPLRLSSLPVLEKAAKGASLDALATELAKEAADAARDGADGGRGGSARAAADRGRYDRLGPLDVVFELRFADGKIAIRDTLVDAAPVVVDVVWQPVNVTVDGLALTVFGGYVVVRRLDYGGASVATGSPSAATLEELATYLPVPASGALRVHANGAVSYGE